MFYILLHVMECNYIPGEGRLVNDSESEKDGMDEGRPSSGSK